MAFLVVVLALDWLIRTLPAMRARAHLLWSVNPLMLWAVMAGGHVDGLAVGIAVLAFAVLGRTVVLAREAGRISTVRALGSGLLLGAATAVKVPFVLLVSAWPGWLGGRPAPPSSGAPTDRLRSRVAPDDTSRWNKRADRRCGSRLCCVTVEAGRR